MLKPPTDIVAAAKACTVECSIDQVREALNASVLLIDVREHVEFLKGHINGAVHLPRGILEFEIHKLVETLGGGTDKPNHEHPIVVCCGTSGRSALAAQSLQSLGYNDVKSMAGGMNAWSAAGLPIQS